MEILRRRTTTFDKSITRANQRMTKETTKRKVNTASNLQAREPMHDKSIDRWKLYEEEFAPLAATLKNN